MDGKKPLIGIFTPSYNRAHTLPRLYESLCVQTVMDFAWYIIDDGSTDGTAELVAQWNTQPFPITYVYKENGGLHTGYNRALEVVDNELCVCIDSDDWMPPDAIEKICRLWPAARERGCIGLMGLDAFADGKIVGDAFAGNIEEMYLYEKLVRYRIAGDKKMVHRTRLLRQLAPMPVYEGEKNFNPSYLMYQADQFGKLLVTNEVLCIVEYQPDGMSNSMLKQYRNSPNSFAQIRRQYLQFPGSSFGFRLRNSIHLVASCVLAGKPLDAFRGTPCPLLSLLGFLPGLLLAAYICLKT